MTKANDLASLLDANGDVVSSALDNVPANPTLTSLGIPNHDDITVDGSGNVGISEVSPTSKLTIGGNATTATNPTVQITDTTNGGSITLRGQSPKLFFDVTAGGVGKILMDGAGFEFKDGTLDAEGNVDLKIDSSGNVGIGDSAPSAKLVLRDSSDFKFVMSKTGASAFEIANNGTSGTALTVQDPYPLIFSTNNTERLRIDNSGNVGIGLSSGIDGKLHVLGNTVVGSASATAFSSFTSGGLDVAVGSGTKAFQVWDDNSTSTPRFIVERSGFVGISTASPNAHLQVNGSLGNNTAILTDRNGTAAVTVDQYGTTTFANQVIASNLATSSSGTAMTFSQGASERMRIDNGGNVGIGTTSMVRTLEITDGTSGKIRAKGTNGGFIECHNGTNGVYFGTAPAVLGSGSGGDSVIFTDSGFNQLYYTSGVERMRINSSGNVFINTTTQHAGSKLTVGGTGAYIGVGGSSHQVLIGDDGSQGFLGTLSNSDLQFRTNNTERMRINAAGIVTMPYQPAFCAHATSSSYSANTPIVFQNPQFNIGSHYNATNGRFTAPVSGRYIFYTQILGDNSSTRALGFISVNGASGAAGQNVEISGYAGFYNSIQASTVLNLSANDYVQIVPSNTSYYSASTYQNIFYGYLIG